MQGKVLTVASGKGGVGKTTTAVNLAVALWREGNAVALVDADLGMANLAAVLALEPQATLHDVLSGEAAPEEAIIEAKGGDLLVLPGERDLSGFADADPGELQAVLDDLSDRCDYVIVDTGAGLSYEDVLPLGLADEVILVTTPDPAAIWDTTKTLELSGLLEGPVRGVVVTRALEDTDSDAIAAEIGVELLATIPEDPAVTESVSRGDPLESHAPDAPATLAYRELASSLVSAAPLPEASLYEELANEVDAIIASTDADSSPTGATDQEPTDELDETLEAEPAPESVPDAAEESPGDAEEPVQADAGSAATAATVDDADPAVEDVDDGEDAEPVGAEAEDTDDVEEAPPELDDAAGDDGGEAGATEEEGGDEDAEPEEPSEDDAAEAEDVDDAEDEETTEAKRGGFFGWLGRLF